MIDFIHPRSLLFKRARIYSLIALSISLIGIYFIYNPIRPVISNIISPQDNLPAILPDNPPPPPEILNQFHLPVNKIVERGSTAVRNKNKAVSNKNKTDQSRKVVSATHSKKKNTNSLPKKNWIIIPKMGVDTEILEGDVNTMLWKGVVRMSVGSTPDKGGNTIITAHRYLYRPPNPKTFFLLDKLTTGDIITIYWHNKKYQYKVRESKVVEPDEISILHNTPHPQLTLFSCTPLFTSKQRLVVIADLVQ